MKAADKQVMRMSNRIKRLLVSHEVSKRKFIHDVMKKEKQKYIDKGAKLEKIFREEANWVK